jgi:hypothetical protein
VVVAEAVAAGLSSYRPQLQLGLALCRRSVGLVVQEAGRSVLLEMQARPAAL